MATRYRVYCTPLSSADTYGSEVEITDYVLQAGIKSIKRSIDSEDYDVGTFTYDDLEIKATNVNGILNDYGDLRSIFTYKRDLAKIRVEYENDVDGETIVYQGLINEEATKLDVSKEVISFRVLSRDSVLRKVMISGGSISNGTSFSDAFATIFSDSTIASVLTLDEADIDLPYDGTIDDGSFFDDKSARDALNALLIASGAVILIDDDANVTIRDRTENSDTDTLVLYGPYDIHRRQNVIQLKDYNTGLHRMFTAIRVNEDTLASNDAYAQTFGFRYKNFDLGFMTDADKELEIAETLLDAFKSPKIECMVQVPISVARGVQLLDRVSLNWPLRITPPVGTFLPIIGSAIIGDAATPLPYTYGSISVSPNIAFKVIEVQEDPATFTAYLKLRQIGSSLEDGYFSDDLTGIVGFAVIGVSIIGGTGDGLDMWNPATIGAALIGSTELE